MVPLEKKIIIIKSQENISYEQNYIEHFLIELLS